MINQLIKTVVDSGQHPDFDLQILGKKERTDS